MDTEKQRGRPTLYDETIVPKTREYIDRCVDRIEEYHKTRGDKSDSYDRLVRVQIPTIEGLAVHLGITRETIYQWEKDEDKKEFTDILGLLRAKQADALINNGLSGDYNPTIAKVLLTKHGYRDGVEMTGTDGKDLVVQVVHYGDNNAPTQV
jgi:hypothetical protein